MLEITNYTVNPDLIDTLHSTGAIDRDSIFDGIETATHGDIDFGGFVLLTANTDPKKSALGVMCGDLIHRVIDNGKDYMGIKPRDKQQLCFMYGLERYDLTVALGGAGTGKTTLALAYALREMTKSKKKIVLTKPTKLVGGSSDAWGTLPGSAEEKLEPYFESYLIPMRKLLGVDTQRLLDEWIDSGRVVAQPIETIRGCSFEGCTLIIDEAQNLSTHELASIVSRVAADSKCIILGDPAQIDVGVRWRETGLAQFLKSDAYYNSEIAVGIKLTAQYRGPLAALAAEFLEELSGVGDDDDEA